MERSAGDPDCPHFTSANCPHLNPSQTLAEVIVAQAEKHMETQVDQYDRPGYGDRAKTRIQWAAEKAATGLLDDAMKKHLADLSAEFKGRIDSVLKEHIEKITT